MRESFVYHIYPHLYKDDNYANGNIIKIVYIKESSQNLRKIVASSSAYIAKLTSVHSTNLLKVKKARPF